jgi:hypothetical protein
MTQYRLVKNGKVVCRGSQDQVLAFLSAYYSTDGYVSMKKAYHLQELNSSLSTRSYISVRGHLLAITEDRSVELFMEATLV